jgi:hypothetical protein
MQLIFRSITISCRESAINQLSGRINRSMSTVVRMTASNLIEVRRDGDHEIGDSEANRDDPGTVRWT